MESNWAAENLQTIRTLMERSAVYRRALAPVTTYVGAVGILAAIIGWQTNIDSVRSFIIFWMAVSGLAIGGAFVLVRRQAIAAREGVWSPPTRRVVQAMLPALVLGMGAGLVVAVNAAGNFAGDDALILPPLAGVWAALYGLALHSAGFFMPRGIRWFGWAFVAMGGTVAFCSVSDVPTYKVQPHLLMGLLFGASHLAYGIYLYFTESRKNEA